MHRLLIITHNLGGGVERHVADLQALLSGSVQTEILRSFDSTTVSLETADADPVYWHFQDWAQLLEALHQRRYDWISLQHVHGFPAPILSLANALALPYDLTLHDFYPFCPIYSLSTSSGAYCGEPDVRGCAKCTRERPNAWHWPIRRWRDEMGRLLAGATRITAPSRFVADRIRRHFPDVHPMVWPHPPRKEWIAPVRPVKKVLLIGKLTRMKGLDALLACAKRSLDKELGLVFCVVGYTESPIPASENLPIQIRGEYADRDLPQLLAMERADVIWFPGPYPETYAYTLDAALACGLPIVASKFGAIAERLQEHSDAVLLDLDSEPQAWCDALLAATPLPPQQSDPEDSRNCALDQRDEYRQKFVAPILARPVVPPPPDIEPAPVEIEAIHHAPSLGELSLSSMFEHGVECGQLESRLALKGKLIEIERDYAVLDGYSKRFGVPWFELLDRFEAQTTHLREREAESAQLGNQLLVLRSEAAVLRNENSVLRIEATSPLSENSALRSEAAVLRNDTDVLRNEAAVLRSEANVLRGEAIMLRHENTVLRNETGVLRNEAAVLRNETDVLRGEAVMLRHENTVLRNETDVLRGEAVMLRHENTVLRNETDVLRGEAIGLQQENSVLRTEADVLHNEAEAQRQRLAALVRNVDEQDDQLRHRAEEIQRNVVELTRAVGRIKELEVSTSWRVTAPLRAVSQLAKKIRYKVRRHAALMQHASARLPLAWKILRTDGPQALLQRIQTKLGAQQFVASSESAAPIVPIGTLALPSCPADQLPHISIVIPVYGHDEHTFNCLSSLLAHTTLNDIEIIVVDDASPVPVIQALGGVSGVNFVRATQNGGFIESCRLGAGKARGEFLILLNNDIQVTPGWLDSLLKVFRLHSDAGLVGARLVYPDGRLQEAGGIVWQDGSAWNWGRGDDPDKPQYRYLRAVDYCSGACLAIRMSDWKHLGGFDKAYAPAYYEDTDLAFRVRQLGKRVYYQPEAKIIHFEGISSGTDESSGIKRHQAINRKTFLARWKSELQTHRPNGQQPQREADRGAKARVLVVEACMITPDQDAGSVRMLAMLELLVELGCKVSLVADNIEYRQPYVGQLQQAGVEVWHHPFVDSVAQLLSERGKDLDVIIFCRHYIAARYLSDIRNWAPQAKIVFDTVDLHYLREQRLAQLDGSKALLESAEATRQQELGVIAGSDLTLVVSFVEQELLAKELPSAAVDIVTIIHDTRQAAQKFGDRTGLLFVGGFRHPPNVDAVTWFVGEVWPLVRQKEPDMTLTIVGSNMPSSIRELKAPNVVVAGFVENMDPLLDSSRISIAPLRYGAGVKGKVNQAMACGLPVVATSAAAEGMNLQDGEDLLIADSPQAFAAAVVRLYNDQTLWEHLAEGGKRNIGKHFSRARAKQTLAELVSIDISDQNQPHPLSKQSV